MYIMNYVISIPFFFQPVAFFIMLVPKCTLYISLFLERLLGYSQVERSAFVKDYSISGKLLGMNIFRHHLFTNWCRWLHSDELHTSEAATFLACNAENQQLTEKRLIMACLFTDTGISRQ